MSSPPSVPYGVIADSLLDRGIVLFLGAAASSVGALSAKALPDGKTFSASLARTSSYPGHSSDPLTKVAQFMEEVAADRHFLLRKIRSTFYSQLGEDYSSSVTDFMNRLPPDVMPNLIVTTNYDILVERTLEQRNVDYLVISHIMRGSKYFGRFYCYDSLKRPAAVLTRSMLEEKLYELEQRDSATVLVYKMHGTARIDDDPATAIDSIVLTETDYIHFLAEDMIRKIPTNIVDILRTTSILFLGYSLEDWNFRVLLQRLLKLQRQDERTIRHWACLLDPDPVEKTFWDKRGVSLYNHSIDKFLASLTENILARQP